MSTLVYTSSQLAAIRHISGPLLVNAGPGSGKTAVIIAHVRYLIHDLGADPEKILTVTFTNAAASEMQERFLKDESSGGASPVFSTIHSMFYHILRHSSSARPLRMISNQDQDAFLKECLPDTGPVSFSLRKELTARISRAVNTGGSVEDIRLPGISSDQLILILRRYQDYKAQQGLLDYDDILTMTLALFREQPDVLSFWRDRFRYLLVDEFQDVNPVQYEALRLLSAPLRDRFGVIQRLEFYNVEELALIIKNSAKRLGVYIDEQGAKEMGMCSRGTPRIANRLLKRVRDYAEVRYEGEITEDIAKEALDIMEVDRYGLDNTDRNMLITMIEKFDGGPVGLDTLAATIGEDSGTIEDVYEPYLVKCGFMNRTPRGRQATDLAYQHLGIRKIT